MDSLFSHGGLNRFKVLVEIASRQPNVLQQDVARSVGISPQAVSEYFQEMAAEGLIESGRRGEWRITYLGTEHVIEQARELRQYSIQVLENVVSDVEIYPAVAGARLEAGQRVGLNMKDGIVLARPATEVVSGATGEATHDAREGQDVGITALQGIIPINEAEVSVFKVPSIRSNGSRRCKIDALARSLTGVVAVEGTEALVCCRMAGREPDICFSPVEAVVSAARMGVGCSLVITDERTHQVLDALSEANVASKLIDCCVK